MSVHPPRRRRLSGLVCTVLLVTLAIPGAAAQAAPEPTHTPKPTQRAAGHVPPPRHHAGPNGHETHGQEPDGRKPIGKEPAGERSAGNGTDATRTSSPTPTPTYTSEAAACPDLTASRWQSDPPWPQAMLDLAEAHRYSEGNGVRVAVVDTGVSAANPQLAGAVAAGGDFVGDGARPTLDCDGHGTVAAGIIAARPSPSSGLVGVAPKATIVSYRWTDGQDRSRVAPMARAIRAAVDDGIRIVNVSSVTETNYIPLEEAVRYAEAHGTLIVAAAGNSGNDGNPVTYPAAYPGVLAVSAVDSSGAWWNQAQTSVPIAVAAPGVQVTGDAPISGNVTDDGTSFAAPFVAGLAALVWSRFPGLTAEQVAHRIEITADDPPSTLPGKKLGWGTIDPVAALTAVVPADADAASATPQPLPYLSLPPAPDHRLRDRAFVLAAAIVGLAVLLAAATATVRAGRRRHGRSHR